MAKFHIPVGPVGATVVCAETFPRSKTETKRQLSIQLLNIVVLVFIDKETMVEALRVCTLFRLFSFFSLQLPQQSWVYKMNDLLKFFKSLSLFDGPALISFLVSPGSLW